ncbi:MAG TPA: hypothetical protein VD866_22955 [Urbifossiella sp.]|nr:hypothetical protein [Urbifossiella sp.]
MNGGKMGIVAGCLGGFIAGVCFTTLGCSSRPKQPEFQPPSVGGQKAPSAVREIDFEKRYDLHCVLFDKELTVFRDCKVVGYTGPAKAGVVVDGGSSSGFSSRDHFQYFDRWLVIEHSDGRLAYIPPNSLRYLEATKGP